MTPETARTIRAANVAIHLGNTIAGSKKKKVAPDVIANVHVVQSAIERLMAAKIAHFAREIDASSDLSSRSINVMFAAYCVASVMYERHNMPIMDDHAFDHLCHCIAQRWGDYTDAARENVVMQKFDREQFVAGTGMGVEKAIAGTHIERVLLAFAPEDQQQHVQLLT